MQLILSCNRYYEKFDRIRTGTCRLIKASRNGIILDTDSIVEEDGQQGVYVMSKQLEKSSFVPVKVLLTDGDKTVVEKNYFVNEEGEKVLTVENYDEIVKEYGEPETSTAYFNERNSRNEIQLCYTTQGTELSYFDHGDEFYSAIIINVDAETKKCNELFVIWCISG